MNKGVIDGSPEARVQVSGEIKRKILLISFVP
jgi:hypothetical protein